MTATRRRLQGCGVPGTPTPDEFTPVNIRVPTAADALRLIGYGRMKVRGSTLHIEQQGPWGRSALTSHGSQLKHLEAIQMETAALQRSE